MDVVKSRIQNSPKVAGQTPKYNWAWGACGTVMKERACNSQKAKIILLQYVLFLNL